MFLNLTMDIVKPGGRLSILIPKNGRREKTTMSRQLEQAREIKQARYDTEVLKAVEFELQGAVGHAGGILTGFSVKFSEVDCLLTLRATIGSNAQIAHVGAPGLGDCLRKAVSEAYRDALRWRPDQYG